MTVNQTVKSENYKRKLKGLLQTKLNNTLTVLETLLGGCKANWDIGIWVIFSGILGYYLSEIGILGYPCGIWDIGILVP